VPATLPFRRRSYWLSVGAIAYVCFGALPSAPRPFVPLLAMVLLPLWLAAVWRRSEHVDTGERRVDPAALRAFRAAHFGATLWVAARLGTPGRAAYDAVANLGTGIASVGALVALARLPSRGGMLAPPSSTRSLDAAAFAGLLWGIAVALPGTRALVASTEVLLDPLAIDYATTTASIGSLLVLVAASFRLRVERRLEIGVVDRVAGALALSSTALCVSIPAAAADIGSPDRVLPLGVLAAALATTWTATTREPTTVSITLRGVLAVMILGVPVALFAAILVRAFPAHAALISLAGSVLAVAVGVIARDVARPLGPEQSRWLEAIEEAARGAMQPDPDAAIRAALEALRVTAREGGAKPELWRASPEEVLTVDVAGYLHVAKAKCPERLYALAEGEPERTLTADVLRALEVRRPEVRPLLAWFESRGAFSATVVLDEDGPLGFLLLPRGRRTKPLTLEEARAARLLTDRISALLAVSSALARSRERELRAASRATYLDGERERLERIIALGAGRHQSFSELVARPVRRAAYSPAARFAIDHVERLGKVGGPIALVAPPGVDAAAWAAIAHLSGPNPGGPLVIVDGAAGAEHDEAKWQDPERSPLSLADGGTLVVLDVAALPATVQEHIARSLGRRAVDGVPSNVPPANLVVSLRWPSDELVSRGRLSRSLAARLGTNQAELPPLSSRAEDLRALVLDRLAAAGVRGRGTPLGIDPAALAALLEHAWPGNDAELRDVLVRAAEVAQGPTVTVADLRAIGFRSAPEAPPAPPPPSESRRRRSSRPARAARGR
jgi:hypothetical protein